MPDAYPLLNAPENHKSTYQIERELFAPLLAQARRNGAHLTARLRAVADLDDVQARALRRFEREGWDRQADQESRRDRYGF